MRYDKIRKALFLSRPNRFIAKVLLDGREESVHVKNTGRCKELLLPKANVYLQESDNPARRTKYDLVAVEKQIERQNKKQTILVNMDSQAPNKVAAEWIRSDKKRFHKILSLKPEFTLGDSRFDFFVDYQAADSSVHKMLIEVKGCTLEQDGIVLFPDAPTERGLKHVQKLTAIHKSGTYECMILIIVQLQGALYFTPNRQTHADFADALLKAKEAGVEVLALECSVNPDSLSVSKEIPVRLQAPALSLPSEADILKNFHPANSLPQPRIDIFFLRRSFF